MAKRWIGVGDMSSIPDNAFAAIDSLTLGSKGKSSNVFVSLIIVLTELRCPYETEASALCILSALKVSESPPFWRARCPPPYDDLFSSAPGRVRGSRRISVDVTFIPPNGPGVRHDGDFPLWAVLSTRRDTRGESVILDGGRETCLLDPVDCHSECL